MSAINQKMFGLTNREMPYVSIKLGSLFYTGLLDSGSCASLISADVYSKLKLTCKILTLEPVEFSCESVSGQPLNILGMVKIPVRIDNFTWRYRFLVATKLSSSVIIGSDFIRKTGLLLDLRHKQFYFSFSPKHKIRLVSYAYKRVQASTECNLLQDRESDKDIEQPELSHVSENQANVIRDLIRQFPEVFTTKLGFTNVLQYQIQLNDTTPVKFPPYRLSPPKMQIMRSIINEMLEKGIIRHSTSQYSSPIFLVPKGKTDFRPVVDYRALNSKIKIESVPLPDIHSCFSWFAKAKIFSTLDLNSAYHQIGLTEDSKHMTAFATDWNLFEFCRVPFGLATGAQVLTRLLDKIFSDVKFQFVYHYLDDLVVYSEDFEQHMEHLREVFFRLKRAGLTVNPGKVKIASPSL